MKSFNLTEWALGHRAVVLFLILVIAIGGVLGFARLGQLEDPIFSVPSMTAMVIWPGATAQQVQDEVLNRMEKKFEQLDHFEKVKTYARQGYGAMLITVVGGTSHADQQEAWYQARKKFSDIKLELLLHAVQQLVLDLLRGRAGPDDHRGHRRHGEVRVFELAELREAQHAADGNHHDQEEHHGAVAERPFGEVERLHWAACLAAAPPAAPGRATRKPGAIFCTPAVTTSAPAGNPDTSTSSLRYPCISTADR